LDEDLVPTLLLSASSWLEHVFIVILNAIEAFHAPFGNFECLGGGGLASSTLALSLMAFEGSTAPVSYKSLLMKPLDNVIVYMSFFASSIMAFNSTLFNNWLAFRLFTSK